MKPMPSKSSQTTKPDYAWEKIIKAVKSDAKLATIREAGELLKSRLVPRPEIRAEIDACVAAMEVTK